MDIIEVIRSLPQGTVVSRSATASELEVKGWGHRRSLPALIYYIPNRSGGRRYEKGVTVDEWRQAYEVLSSEGKLSRQWAQKHIPACLKEGSCNFTAIGGVFCLLGIAEYAGPGVYRKIGL